MKSKGFRVQPCVSIRLSKCRNLRSILLILKMPMQMIYSNCLSLFCDDFHFIPLHIFQGFLINGCMMLSTGFQPSMNPLLKIWTVPMQDVLYYCNLECEMLLSLLNCLSIYNLPVLHCNFFFLQTRFWEYCCTWGLVILTYSHLINSKRRNQL